MLCAFFDLSYLSEPILELIDRRGHEVIRPGHFSYNMLFDELEAAKQWAGIKSPDEYMALPRPTRALMVAHMRLSTLVHNISEFDAAKKREAKRNR